MALSKKSKKGGYIPPHLRKESGKQVVVDKTKLNGQIKNAVKKFSKKQRKKPVKWFNEQNIIQKHKSIAPNVIPSIDLSDLSKDKFLSQYRYPMNSFSCHWLIPNVLLVGEDPTDFFEDLVEDGIKNFISLREGKQWYQHKICILSKNKHINNDIQLTPFPINDFGIADDQQTITFVKNLMETIIKSESNGDDEKEESNESKKAVTYLHCLGGHGRTGLISSMILSVVYGMDDDIAVKFLNEIHKMRHPHCGPKCMPESKSQRAQISRLHKDMIKIREKLQQ